MRRKISSQEGWLLRMTIALGIDVGAERLGWGLVEKTSSGYALLDSGLDQFPRGMGKGGKKEPFQEYRERLLKHWVVQFSNAMDVVRQHCDQEFEVVFEIVPAIGFGQSGGATQAQLAQVVATVCQAMCEEWGVAWSQVAATTVKKKVTGYGDATKVQIRDAVMSVFPELEPRKQELTTTADEADGIAIALVSCGYSVKKKGPNPRRRKKSRS